jgi:hypothetical protein
MLSAGIPFCWQPLWGQAPGVRVEASHKPKQQSNLARDNPQSTQVGTQSSPLIVETHERPKSKEEATEGQKDKEHAARIERWMLIFTGIAALATAFLVGIGWRGVNAAKDTLLAIQEQSDLTQSQLELSHRPWISAEVSVGSELVFDERGGTLMLSAAIKNVGHSVAKHVSLWTEFVIGGDNVQTAHEKFCNVIRQQNNASDYGWLLFPDQGITEPRPVIARLADVERGVREGPFKDSGEISLHLIGCVDYQSTLDPSKHHQTKFVYLVSRVDPSGRLMGNFNPKVAAYGRIVITPTMHGASAD